MCPPKEGLVCLSKVCPLQVGSPKEVLVCLPKERVWCALPRKFRCAFVWCAPSRWGIRRKVWCAFPRSESGVPPPGRVSQGRSGVPSQGASLVCPLQVGSPKEVVVCLPQERVWCAPTRWGLPRKVWCAFHRGESHWCTSSGGIEDLVCPALQMLLLLSILFTRGVALANTKLRMAPHDY